MKPAQIVLTALLYPALLYVGIWLGANPVLAGSELEALRQGDMRKIAFSDPKAAVTAGFWDETGGPVTLEAFYGKVVLLNFWATWCAPCRAEMPSIDRLQAALGGADFQVVAIATGRNPLEKIKGFFADTGVENLTIYLDPKQQFAAAQGAGFLPMTLLLDRQGREIGRLPGDAEWDGPEAIKLIKALINTTS